MVDMNMSGIAYVLAPRGSNHIPHVEKEFAFGFLETYCLHIPMCLRFFKGKGSETVKHN